MMVRLLPPSASCSRRVSAELRYGTNTFFLPPAMSASAEMTLPSADSDALMAQPSLSRSPVAPVDSARSLPARSTRFMLDVTSLSPCPSTLVMHVNPMPNTVCARLLVAFILVDATVRLAVPSSILFSISA